MIILSIYDICSNCTDIDCTFTWSKYWKWRGTMSFRCFTLQ